MAAKRLIIIVDSLRYDHHKLLGLEEPIWCIQAMAYSYGTWTAFQEINRYMQQDDAAAKVILTAGWPQKLDSGNITMLSKSLFPLKDNRQDILDIAEDIATIGCKGESQPSEVSSLFLVHDFWVHNYWQDVVPDTKGPCDVKDKRLLLPAYKNRVAQTGKWIEQLRGKLGGWDIYITADHAELFWNGKSPDWGHGPRVQHNPLLYQIPIIGLDGAPFLNYTQLFAGPHHSLPAPRIGL